MKTLFILIIFLICGTTLAKSPKYVFFFIGDGMGVSHSEIAEYFVKKTQTKDNSSFAINHFPVVSIVKTYATNVDITDSGAAGTALATGHRTNYKHLSVTPNGERVKTIVEEAIKKGWSTGIITSTKITDATPAAYMGHHANRKKENNLAEQITESGVNFIAGGGLGHFIPRSMNGSLREDEKNLLELMSIKGYTLFTGIRGWEDFKTLSFLEKQNIFALFSYKKLPFVINQNESGPSLETIVDKAITCLSKHKKPFFIMVEGAKIDTAAHKNDLPTTIHETIAFNKAIQRAVEFYQEHKNETLIIVTTDHETGGLGLGHIKDEKNFNISPILKAKTTMVDSEHNEHMEYKGNKKEWFEKIDKYLGLLPFSKTEMKIIKNAMSYDDVYRTKSPLLKTWFQFTVALNASSRELGADAPYPRTSIAINRILSARANVYWTTYGHTASPVPLYAIGVGARLFSGVMANYEVGRKLAKIMGLDLSP